MTNSKLANSSDNSTKENTDAVGTLSSGTNSDQSPIIDSKQDHRSLRSPSEIATSNDSGIKLNSGTENNSCSSNLQIMSKSNEGETAERSTGHMSYGSLKAHDNVSEAEEQNKLTRSTSATTSGTETLQSKFPPSSPEEYSNASEKTSSSIVSSDQKSRRESSYLTDVSLDVSSNSPLGNNPGVSQRRSSTKLSTDVALASELQSSSSALTASQRSSRRKTDQRKNSTAPGPGRSSGIFSNIFAPSYQKVVDDFEKLFPPSEFGNCGILLTNYGCALQTDPGLLEQGKLYVTSQGLFFNSFIRRRLLMFISFSEIEVLKKHQVMVLFPTAILVAKKDRTSTVFASFTSRDKSLALINYYFQCFQKDSMYFEHGKEEVLWKELNRNYGRKFQQPVAARDSDDNENGDNSAIESENSSAAESTNLRGSETRAGSVKSPTILQPEVTAVKVPLIEIESDDRVKILSNGSGVSMKTDDQPRSKVGKRSAGESNSLHVGVNEINGKTLTRDEGDVLTETLKLSPPSNAEIGFRVGGGIMAMEEDEDDESYLIEPVISSLSDQEELQCSCYVHEAKSGWTQYLDNIYYISVDSAFNMLFEKSDFYHEVLKRRKATRFTCAKWKASGKGGSTGKRERELTYLMPTNSSVPMAPKAVDCTEMQYVDAAECEAEKIYGARATVKNHNKFSDNFVIHTKYCLTRSSRQRFRLQLYSRLEFTSSWVLMKDVIRDQVDVGMKDHCEALDKALQLKISESKIAPPNASRSAVVKGSSNLQSGAANMDGSEKSDSASNLPGTSAGLSHAGLSRKKHNGTLVNRDSSIGQRERCGSIHEALPDVLGSRLNEHEHRLGSSSSELNRGGGTTRTRHRGGTSRLSRLSSGGEVVWGSRSVQWMVILLLVLASISHSMLIYQLSNISSQGSFRGTKSTYFDDRSSTNNQFSSSSINHRESSLDESSQEHLQQKEQSKQSKEQETFTHQQLLALIVNSQVQQQNQFQQIMKNSLAVLEVMTNNMNSMSMLMSSHMVQQSSVVNEFAKNVNEHAQTSELKEENTGSQPELQAKHKLNSFGEPLTKETSALKSDKTEMFASKKFPQKLDDEL